MICMMKTATVMILKRMIPKTRRLRWAVPATRPALLKTISSSNRPSRTERSSTEWSNNTKTFLTSPIATQVGLVSTRWHHQIFHLNYSNQPPNSVQNISQTNLNLPSESQTKSRSWRWSNVWTSRRNKLRRRWAASFSRKFTRFFWCTKTATQKAVRSPKTSNLSQSRVESWKTFVLHLSK